MALHGGVGEAGAPSSGLVKPFTVLLCSVASFSFSYSHKVWIFSELGLCAR